MSESNAANHLENIVLRGYRRADLEAMFRLDEICFEKPFRFSKSAMRRFAEARKGQVILALHGAGGELAGFSIVHVERVAAQVEGYLLTLDVAPLLRRQGLAQLLLTHAENKAREAGCEAMRLHVFVGNAGAVALYEKLGYTRVGVAQDFYGGGLPAWVYRKALV